MKTLTINTAAGWGAGVRSFLDGDIFRESNIDLSAGDIADRLGYLKAQSDASGKLAADQTWAGSNEFDTGTGGGAKTISVTGDGDFVLENGGGLQVASGSDGGQWTASAFTTNADCDAQFNGILEAAGRLIAASVSLSDASAALTGVLIHRVPQLTANRTYTLPSGAAGQLALLKRTRTADAFTAALNDGGGAIGTISASSAGWILAMCTAGTTWVVVAWGGTVTGISTST
jgi:hypothetical protein